MPATIFPSLMEACFQRCVSHPRTLNRSGRDQSSTYGEILPSGMSAIFEQITINTSDVFLDLGSGIGNIVLNAAAMFRIKAAYGIEMMPLRSRYAQTISICFKNMLDYFKFRVSPFSLMEGDFTAPEYDKYIEAATIIFINNYVFKPETNNWLKNRLLKKRNGTIIVTTSSLFATKARNR